MIYLSTTLRVMNSQYRKLFFDLKNFEHEKLFEDFEYIWTPLLNLKKYLNSFNFSKQNIKLPPTSIIENPEQVFIGENTSIEPGVYIKGPCIIGRNCSIRHGSYIRGNVIIGDNCIIGHATEIKHSILLNNSNAAHFAYVGDSIFGNNVNLGAGVKCANFKLNKQNIKVFFENKILKTEMNKLGAIIGDNVQIGCNSVLNPGTIIEKDAICYPCVNVKGHILKKSIIKNSSKSFKNIKELSNETFSIES